MHNTQKVTWDSLRACNVDARLNGARAEAEVNAEVTAEFKMKEHNYRSVQLFSRLLLRKRHPAKHSAACGKLQARTIPSTWIAVNGLTLSASLPALSSPLPQSLATFGQKTTLLGSWR